MSQPRGILFKKYIENKFNIPGINILRIDLVFDNECMINMLEQRGHAIKIQNFKMLQEIERDI